MNSDQRQIDLENALSGGMLSDAERAMDAGADIERTPLTALRLRRSRVDGAHLPENLTLAARAALRWTVDRAAGEPQDMLAAVLTRRDGVNRRLERLPRAFPEHLFPAAEIGNTILDQIINRSRRLIAPDAAANAGGLCILLNALDLESRRAASELWEVIDRQLRHDLRVDGVFGVKHLSLSLAVEAAHWTPTIPAPLVELLAGSEGEMKGARMPLPHFLIERWDAMSSRRALLQAIVESGWDVNTRSPSDGSTMLLLAVRRGEPRLVERLLEAGADSAVADARGWNAAVYAGSAISRTADQQTCMHLIQAHCARAQLSRHADLAGAAALPSQSPKG